MENASPEEWSAELAAELQRLSGLLRQDSPRVSLVPGERRLVAILFLDLKDYTGLAERLDHETLHHLVRSLMGLLAGEVEMAGGYVDKYEGDMIMALFGAGGHSEVPCQRAVSCGLKMLERVRSAAGILNRRGISLAARVGVSYGAVTVAPDPSGHLTATGDEVNVASRLQSHAPDGGLLASAAVRRAAGDYFGWEDAGEKSIRGRTEPVHAFLAVGAGPLRMSWWREAATCASTPFVDRSEEVCRLADLMSLGSESRVALVTGEPGSGKTALVGEVVSRLEAEGGPRVVTGRSMAFDQPPYLLWTEVLRDLARPAEPGGYLRGLLEDAGPGGGAFRMEVAGDLVDSVLSGDFRGQLENGPGDSDRMLSGLLGDALGAAAPASGGLALVLDDLQWMDSRSASVLGELLDAGLPEDVSAVLVSRDLPEMMDEGDVLHIRLEGLGDGALSELAEHLLRGRCGLVPEEITILARRTAETVGRFPLYFRDMILYLLESGSLESVYGGRGGMEAGLNMIPGTLAALLASRFDQLPEDHRRMLQYASVLGQEFPAELLFDYLESVGAETSCGLPGDTEKALGLLVDKKLLRVRGTPAGSTVSFRTPLARRVAYDTLLLHNRRILHAIAAGRCLEKARPGMAARHMRLSGDVRGALRQGLAELELASEGYQTSEVIRWSDRLLEWAAEDGSGARAEDILGILDHRRTALELEGRIGECRRTLERMLELSEGHGLPDWEARAMIGLGALMSVTGAPRKALDLLSRAARTAGGGGERELLAMALANRASCHISLGELERAEEDVSSALRLAEALDDPPLAARCLLVRSQLEIGTERLGEAEQTLRALISRESGPSVRITMAARANLGAVLSGMGRFEEAESSFSKALRGAESIGDRRVQASCLCNLASLRRRSGDPRLALKTLERALSLAREIGDRSVEAEILVNMGTALADMGRPAEAFHRSLEAFESLRRLGGSRHLGLALRNAAVFAERSDSPGLLAELTDVLDAHGDLLEPDERARSLLLAARAARARGMLIRVAQLCRRAEAALRREGGEVLAEIRALQALCHLQGGSRSEAMAALREAEELAGNTPASDDLRNDLEELRAVLSG
jgi:class 3 adenylate cyclase/tetratricopeptide (TPR) repeat protein